MSLGRFSAEDWDFEDAKAEAIHGLHPYPARFVPQIPRKVIRMLRPDTGTAVLDPFCGSGTVLVESISQGIDAFGIDVNPLATLITRVKTTPLPLDFAAIGFEAARRASRRYRSGDFAIPPIPRIDHWFETDVQKALSSIIREISLVQNEDTANALRLAVSRIVVRVSNQESNTRYAAVKKDINAKAVFSLFRESISLVDRVLSSFNCSLTGRMGRAEVITSDIMTTTADSIPRKVGLVVTSPPYPNAYEYWLYHKYRMYWLGMDPVQVREREIGARCHFFRASPQTEKDFERQMTTTFALLSNVLARGCFAVFVVGRSVIHGRTVDNVEILKRAALENSFDLEESVERTIARNRRSFNPKHGNIEKEHVVLFRRRSE